MSAIIAGTAAKAHSVAASILAASPIKVGDNLPAAPVKEDSPDSKTDIHNIDGKILLVSYGHRICAWLILDIQLGVPAAFSPPCGSQIPEYIEKYQDFVAKGVKGIYVVAVNDAFVTKFVSFFTIAATFIQILSQSLEDPSCKRRDS